jgi:hypothetical protein
MKSDKIEIIKASGERVKFSLNKLKFSLKKSGASNALVEQIVTIVQDELYKDISTKEIYNRAFALLKRKKSYFASKYKLKKAIYELGPTGFPFERFIGSILKYSGYETRVGEILQGKCVSHEIDVIAHKKRGTILIECKFHGEQGLKCNVKVPMYINSRYQDIKAHWDLNKKNATTLKQGWVVTNTRFTKDALEFGSCCGLYLLSWDYPKENSLKERIDRLGLYPITVSTVLTNREKIFLLDRDVILCRNLIEESFYLDHLGVSDIRKIKILNELKLICN